MIYKYKCNKCGCTKIIEQSMSDSLIRNLPCSNKDCDGILNQDLSEKLKKMSFSIPCTFNDEEYRPKKYDDSELTDYIDGLDG